MTAEARSEHDPVLVTEEDLEDLSTFTGLSRAACLNRLRGYSTSELAEAWRRASPKTSEEILAFYQSTDLYIWALMQWHASPTRRPYREALEYLVQHYPAAAGWRRVYDFGCGVGTDALYLSAHGYDVMPDPLGAAKQMVKALRPRGVIVQQGSFEDKGEHPCHLTNGVRHFSGLKWHIHLAGLGLKKIGDMVYRKASMVERPIQMVRYGLWRATGLWLVRVSDPRLPPEGDPSI